MERDEENPVYKMKKKNKLDDYKFNIEKLTDAMIGG